MQLDALKRAGVADSNVYVEKVSGASRRRPALERAMRALRPGDTLVVWRLDRMGRNLLDLLNRMQHLQRNGIKFKSLTEAIDTGTIMGQLLLHILGAIAQFERQLTQERTNAGIRAHVRRGGNHGRKPTFDKLEAERLLRQGKIVSEVAAALGVKRQVIANHWSAEEARRLARLGPLKHKR